MILLRLLFSLFLVPLLAAETPLDREGMQRYGLGILREGIHSNDPEIAMLSTYGASIAMHETAYALLEESLESRFPQVQLAALAPLAARRNEQSLRACHKALSSPFALLRFEACYLLASMRADHATAQIDSLMMKAPPELHPIFPQLFALQGDAEATVRLKQLLNHSDLKVRLAAILAVAEYQRDDFLPQIRILSSQLNPAQQEACAFALGKLGDRSSKELLQSFTRNHQQGVKVAAWVALQELGDPDAKGALEKMAKEGDLFACTALGRIDGTSDLLASLLTHSQADLRFNAALALLEKGDPRCSAVLFEILRVDEKDLSLLPIYSTSKALSAWKSCPSSRQRFAKDPAGYEQTIRIKEAIVEETLGLPQEQFLQLTDKLLKSDCQPLVPVLIASLERLGTPEALTFLKTHKQKLGSPLIRRYCALALFRLKEEPISPQLYDWMKKEEEHELISFRPLLSYSEQPNLGRYSLTPKETSRLLIEVYDAIAATQEDHGLKLLHDMIEHGNKKNRYALAGLLIRAAQ